MSSHLRPSSSPQRSPRGQFDVVQLEYAALFRFAEERCQLLGGEGFHLPVLQLGQGAPVCRVSAYQLLVDGEIHGGGDHLVDIPHSFGAETLGLLFGFGALYPAAAQQLFVQPLQIQRG